MKAWSKDMGSEDNDKRTSKGYVKRAESLVTYLAECMPKNGWRADPNAFLTKALDMTITHEGPTAKLGPNRCKRFAALYEDGVLKALEISASEDDPAGDDDPSASCVDNMLTHC
mmetsp:Transcript_12477/g.22120  ORF Transcript_12477/g.22120 Transcript_12477/m.22120 type:complete len:114 (+) Transcript_12477:341-682(+)